MGSVVGKSLSTILNLIKYYPFSGKDMYSFSLEKRWSGRSSSQRGCFALPIGRQGGK